MTEGLLKTKLFAPPPRSNQVLRKALLDKLDQACRMGIPTLVSAPAGFGKTTLVAEWARSTKLPVAWLALDEADNTLLGFWSYVDAAIQSVDVHIGEDLRPAMRSMQSPVIQQIITGLINDIVSIGVEFVLVLEDYHLIEQVAIHESLNFLLDHLPPQLHLIITTRSDPPLNLARRRGRGQLVEIRATDLRFSPEETSAFLNETMLLDLAEADIAALGQRTEGWIAGLLMVALSIQDENDRHAFVKAFSGDDRYIADYLIEEVLQRQPVEFQRFLQETSILERLCGPLCDAVTGRQDSRAMLNTLERANLFILPLDNRREWFRYHHLFAELLQKRLRESFTKDEIANLQRLASDWYESQRDITSAIRHALNIPDERSVLTLLEKNAEIFFVTGQLPQFFDLAKLLPVALRKESPFLCIAVAWAGLAANRYSEIPAWLDAIESAFDLSAEAALSDAGLEPAIRAALLEVLVCRLQLPSERPQQAQYAHILAIQNQLNSLPPDQKCLLNPVNNLQPVIAFNLGLHAEATGDLVSAARAFTDSASLARQAMNSNLYHLANGHLANIQYAQGHLQAACQTHERGLAEARNLDQMVSPFVAISLAGLGTIHYEWNDLATAERYFTEALAQARLWNQWESLVPLALGRARLKLRSGEREAAILILEEMVSPPLEGMDLPINALAARLNEPAFATTWLTSILKDRQLEPNPISEGWLLDTARLMASLERTELALSLIKKIIQFAENGGRIDTLIRALVAQALVGNQPEALRRALQLAEPEGYLATFLDEGEPMRNMLNHILKKADLPARLNKYVQRLLGAFAPVAQKTVIMDGLVENLTERELEVLRYMAEGYSNPEIAGRLYLSPNTLKAHAQNIFMKMDVHNRLQAVSRGKELGLIE